MSGESAEGPVPEPTEAALPAFRHPDIARPGTSPPERPPHPRQAGQRGGHSRREHGSGTEPAEPGAVSRHNVRSVEPATALPATALSFGRCEPPGSVVVAKPTHTSDEPNNRWHCGSATIEDGCMPTRLHDDEVDIDASLARRLLTEQMPEYSTLPLRRVASGGTENAVFRLGDDLALRMPLRPDAVESLLKEVRWLSVVAAHLSLEVPEVVSTGEPGAGYPFPWAVVRWLAGEDALTSRFDSIRDAARTLGQFVAELQGIDMTDAPWPGAEGFHRGLPLVERDSGFRTALAQCDGLVDVERVEAVWDDALAAADWEGPPVWLHADLIPGNVLLRDGRLVGVLDFGTMATGDPAYDVTPAWHLLDRDSRSAFREIVGADEATWRRARGLVVSGGVIALPYYLHSNPSMVETARRGIGEVLADLA
ncbi:MAG: phosphotransferase [Propionibacteriales bacterium]|nr:phosphotransferase [Propionibacteriales bacterium]